ncbi:hypothetical protein GGS20DRAFT_59472 [Poronia punctata]|nr:hypothetical protein GGS20DRAFT_59472 [Poronia punctata]
MACCAKRLGLLADPHRIAILLLGITILLLTLTIVGPSSSAYLIRLDSISQDGASTPFTTWFSSRGYCTASGNNNSLSSENRDIQCHAATFGYDIATALTRQDGTVMVEIADADIWSGILTKPLAILSTVTIALCLISVAAHRQILHKPRPVLFGVALVACVLGNVTSGVTLGFELLFETLVAEGVAAPGTTANTTAGPLSYAVKFACVTQLLACAVSFYTCIGGRFRCEEYARRGNAEMVLHEDPEENKGLLHV